MVRGVIGCVAPYFLRYCGAPSIHRNDGRRARVGERPTGRPRAGEWPAKEVPGGRGAASWCRRLGKRPRAVGSHRRGDERRSQ
ncbi:unnamed protein product, partial [Amoebophrya sp. A120]|eukprot:GSA120T00007138001.1